MTRKDYIAMADRLRSVKHDLDAQVFTAFPGCDQRMLFQRIVDEISSFFAADNPQFRKHTFLGYLNGECGPSGGRLKK